MIIDVHNFLKKAKKYPTLFKVAATNTSRSGKPYNLITFSQILSEDTNEGFLDDVVEVPQRYSSEATPVKVYLFKGEVAGVEFPAFSYPYGIPNLRGSECLDTLYHLSLKKAGVDIYDSYEAEFATRISKGYVNNVVFKHALNRVLKQFKYKTQQTEYVLSNSLPYALCPITKQWETSNGFLAVYLDGKRTTISRKGWKLLINQNQFDEIDGNRFFWTDPDTIFYQVEGFGRVSLFNIIRCSHMFQECPDCNTLYFESGENLLCPHCYPGVTRESIFQSYSARAERVFEFKHKKSDGKTPLYLGVELELENRTDENLISTWKLLRKHAIIKRDGSVSNGLEICTAPASLAVHEEEFKAFFEKVKDLNLRAESNCGMHVHVDRSNLTELQIGKMLAFMYNKENIKFINTIAGRKDNNYCSLKFEKTFTSGLYFDGDTSKEYRKSLRRNASEGRYTGLNLTPAKTIEFRIFASTIVFEEFMRNLEFVQSMVDFTKPSAVTVKSIKDYEKKEVYLNFLKENRKQYPRLFAFVSSNNFN